MNDTARLEDNRLRLGYSYESGVSTISKGVASKVELMNFLDLSGDIAEYDYETMQVEALSVLEQIRDAILRGLSLIEKILEEAPELSDDLEWIWKRLLYIVYKDLLDLTLATVTTFNEHLAASYQEYLSR